MDPKQKTEGQSAFEPGQLGSSTLSTGANVSRTMESLNSATNTSRTSGNVFNNRFHKVEAGTGDIIIPGDTKKPKQPMDSAKLKRIALFAGIGVGIVVLILVIVLVVSNLGGNKKSNTNTTGTTVDAAARAAAAKTAFNEYLSMVITGDSAAEEYTATDGTKVSFEEVLEVVNGGAATANVFYADQLLSAATSDTRTNFFNELNDIYLQFEENYAGENMADIFYLSYYYHDFALLGRMNEQEIITYYNNNGFDATLTQINSVITVDSSDDLLYEYLENTNAYARSFLNLINEAKTTYNCPLDENLTVVCNLQVLPTYPAFEVALATNYTSAETIKNHLYQSSLSVLKSLYAEYYGEEEVDESL